MSYKGYKMSAESRQKIRLTRLGKKASNDTKTKMSLSRRGKKFSQIAINNIRKGIRENRYNEEYAKKLSATKQGEKNPKVVLNDEIVTQIRFEYKEALEQGKKKVEMQYYLANKYGVKRPTISDIVLGRTWKHLK